MSNLLKRVFSGLILGGVAIAGTVYLPSVVFKFIIGFVSAVAAWEVSKLLSKKDEAINPLLVAVFGFFCSLMLMYLNVFLPVLLIFLFAFTISSRVFKLNTLTLLIFSLVYPVYFVSSLGFLHQESKYFVLVLFATVWAGDTMAYIAGKLIGKHRLAPRLSPKKTWEGAVGSFTGSVFAGSTTAYFLGVEQMIIPVVVSAVVMQIGDLFESFIKRQVGEKDSSHIIPGHGGVLDRIDALIFASVVFLVFVQIKNTL